MKNYTINKNMNKFNFSTIKNIKKTQINNDIKRNNKSIISNINKNNFKDSLMKDNDTNKNIHKYCSNYEGSIYNINTLIDKMNSLKQLMYSTTDLKSMLTMDQYGLKYSNDLRRNINSAKKLMSPHAFSPKNNKYNKYESAEKKNNYEINLNYFKRIKTQDNLVKKNNKRFENEFFYSNNDFDLINLLNINKNKKEEIKQILDNEKKDKKLYHLKTELYLIDQKLKDSYFSENKIKNNLTFIRDEISKDNQYSQVKSKYKEKNKNKNKRKKNIILDKYNTNCLKNFSNNPNNRNNIIKIKLNESENENKNKNNNNTNEIEETTIKHNKNMIRFKDRINSYKARKKFYKSNNNIIDDIYNNSTNQKNKIYNLKTYLATAPNLSIFNKSINIKSKNKNIKKISLTHLTNSNNSQENTTLNSLNSSSVANDILYPKYKNTIKIIKNYKKNINNFNVLNDKDLKKSQKTFLMNQINSIMNKSNNIKKYFLNTTDEAAKLKKKFFSKHTYNYKKNTELNINEINKYFNFSNREDIDENKIIIENANKVKATMDKKCSKILDNVLNELFFKDRQLNKEYLGLSSFEKKLLKIKRENDIKKMNKDRALKKNELEKDKILDIFIPENDEIINILKENKDNINNSIEKIYIKTKVLKNI